jgi:hypothetical protein
VKVKAYRCFVNLEKPTGEVAEYFKWLVKRTRTLGADSLSITVLPTGDIDASFSLKDKELEVSFVEDMDETVFTESSLPSRPDGCYWNYRPAVGAEPEDVLVARLVGVPDVD